MARGSDGGRLRALLVEDDPADAALVTRLLRRTRPDGFDVTIADRLEAAVAALAAAPDGFDVVLADLGLPDSCGIATLDGLTQAAPAVAVVVLTGQDDEALALDAVRRGAQDDLVKGSGDGAILSRVVRYAIERKATEAALREARDAAEQAARAKSVFLAMMGHEIRTPLNGVLGMARLLLETPLATGQRAHVDTLLSAGELLLGLVNDLLDFARLDAEALTLESEVFDLAATVEEVRLVLAPRAGDKGLALTCRLGRDCPRRVRGDRLRLRQILFNLVGNAIKFTDQGAVTLTVEPAGGERLEFVVGDTGIGIPPEVGPALFEEFWQGGDGATRRRGGAGLGLAICRRLCRLMGGEIGYDSRPGQGSRFRVELPLPEACGPEESPVVVAPSPGPSRRILLADDNPVNRAVAAGLLERRGHQVTAVADGTAAVAAAAASRFDLILLDWRMPGLDGLAAARAIRALPGEAPPLYLLTAHAQAEAAEQSRAAGLAGVLAKPFRVEDVLRLLAGSGPPLPPPLVALADLAVDRHDLGAERMNGLLALFRRSAGADLDRLLGLVASGALAEAGSTAHRLAGAAASLHLRPLSERCRDLEAAARRGDAAAVAALAADLAPLWQASVEALAAALA